MRKSRISIFFITLGFILISCSSVDSKTMFSAKDENIIVSYNIDDFEGKEVEIKIKNNSNKDVLVLITEATVLTVDGNKVNLMRVSDALSKENTIIVKNMLLKPNITLTENFVAVGYLRKQILKDEFVLLPWIDEDRFELSIPYIIDGKKHVIDIKF
ncbi:MAG: hypothetical protein PQJ49_09730 [Sphaerochaetaceae bacterium]|nr:hypothetical protein [Sphaerochaetaceae bacterium]MDC7250181.1 hypothetical protein [Sphaerochaetaceae bacterium]